MNKLHVTQEKMFGLSKMLHFSCRKFIDFFWKSSKHFILFYLLFTKKEVVLKLLLFSHNILFKPMEMQILFFFLNHFLTVVPLLTLSQFDSYALYIKHATVFFFKKLVRNTVIEQRCIKLINLFSNGFPQKLLSSTTVFNIDNNEERFFKQQISILEWFLKDHVTLKARVMMLKIQFWHDRNKWHFKIFFYAWIFMFVCLVFYLWFEWQVIQSRFDSQKFMSIFYYFVSFGIQCLLKATFLKVKFP